MAVSPALPCGQAGYSGQMCLLWPEPRAGNEVSAKAGLIEAFLLLRSRISKRGCRVLAGFVPFVFSQEASRKNSLCWGRGLNSSGSTSIPLAPVIGAEPTRAVGAISLGLDLLCAELCDTHLLPQLWGRQGSWW